jgi:hypothetical protein
MLDVNNERYYIPTPYPIEKMKKFASMTFSARSTIEKTEEGKNCYFKTNVLVPKTNV